MDSKQKTEKNSIFENDGSIIKKPEANESISLDFTKDIALLEKTLNVSATNNDAPFLSRTKARPEEEILTEFQDKTLSLSPIPSMKLKIKSFSETISGDRELKSLAPGLKTIKEGLEELAALPHLSKTTNTEVPYLTNQLGDSLECIDCVEDIAKKASQRIQRVESAEKIISCSKNNDKENRSKSLISKNSNQDSLSLLDRAFLQESMGEDGGENKESRGLGKGERILEEREEDEGGVLSTMTLLHGKPVHGSLSGFSGSNQGQSFFKSPENKICASEASIIAREGSNTVQKCERIKMSKYEEAKRKDLFTKSSQMEKSYKSLEIIEDPVETVTSVEKNGFFSNLPPEKNEFKKDRLSSAPLLDVSLEQANIEVRAEVMAFHNMVKELASESKTKPSPNIASSSRNNRIIDVSFKKRKKSEDSEDNKPQVNLGSRLKKPKY